MWQEDEQFMGRALQLAQNGKATVSPNPMVGCVIVHEGKIIGEGWHQKAGEPHAEVLAIQSVKDPALLSQSTVYVTLEPCAHFGKTPPCAHLLVDKKVKKVVIGCTDPNPLVSGKGIRILKNEGIEVVQDVLEKECIQLNHTFFTAIGKGRPYIILKWAQTADGYIARANFDAKWISSVLSRQLVHKWRSECDAILVGKNTVKYDNPQLNTREWGGKDPIRLVIDHHCQLPNNLHVFDGSVPTFIFNMKEEKEKTNTRWVKLNEQNFIQEMLNFLQTLKIQSILIEGGANTLQQFIDAQLWDEARVFISPNKFGEGIKVPELKNASLVKQKIIEEDVFNILQNNLNTYLLSKILNSKSRCPNHY
ncbi:bifunctional diaminohydroxyphosphoribosylaminopyrimidine deaminase/5-amino-6-(5-phosphoribosylamino)uracil reductase RibD [Marivirga sp. S37H4]|uniref:Riboflavin biosynthesis protein RibD n=1 Tax=Marivirga aurantiaca TaxID=2802615 RepID=A0A934WYG4_9BACT|nr:bifunctional diaminohydroxyphosphoribosylaminopyrimidine deaminase/5-amino-6-(5-phosphoribosylamino)uracil reductase RibD [Marivirga aurantiaca]MBK6265192.1 bifunctional diaminohydroxyphosphoribosylaminopyrimidine deaminase/5-amino-6-(5-phosphoribosylamino)uracil reductase RibD [Marivirga aurantiaca]